MPTWLFPLLNLSFMTLSSMENYMPMFVKTSRIDANLDQDGDINESQQESIKKE